jgi:hypothetical protein
MQMEGRLSDFLPTQIIVQSLVDRILPRSDPLAMSTSIYDQIAAREQAATGIAHCLIAMWLGVLGGVLAMAMATRRQGRPEEVFPTARSNDTADAAKPNGAP